MSLRADIHDALDAELPRVPALENKVVALFRDDRKDRKFVVYRGRRTRVLRWPLYMVAAGLIVALVGGLIVGGRLLRDLNPQTQIDQTDLHALDARSVRLPTMLPGPQCPVTHEQNASGAIGAGPIYMAKNSLLSASSGGNYWYAELKYEAKAPGLVLIRAVDINAVDRQTKDGQPVWFAQQAHVASAVKTVGPVVQTDIANGGNIDWHPEAAFYGTVSGNQPLKLMYLLGIPYRQGSCVGWQFDGPGFSENIVTSSA